MDQESQQATGLSAVDPTITVQLPALVAHLVTGANVPPPPMTGTVVVRMLRGTATVT